MTDENSDILELVARGDAVISTLGWEPMAQWAAAKGATLALSYPNSYSPCRSSTEFGRQRSCNSHGQCGDYPKDTLGAAPRAALEAFDFPPAT